MIHGRLSYLNAVLQQLHDDVRAGHVLFEGRDQSSAHCVRY